VLPSAGVDVATDDQPRLQPIDRITDGDAAQIPATRIDIDRTFWAASG
jgi:hypothetical protein